MKMTLKQARRLADKTQAEMAEAVGVDRSTYIKIEKNPERATVSQAKKICEVIKQPISAIF